MIRSISLFQPSSACSTLTFRSGLALQSLGDSGVFRRLAGGLRVIGAGFPQGRIRFAAEVALARDGTWDGARATATGRAHRGLAFRDRERLALGARRRRPRARGVRRPREARPRGPPRTFDHGA